MLLAVAFILIRRRFKSRYRDRGEILDYNKLNVLVSYIIFLNAIKMCYFKLLYCLNK